MPPPPPPPPPTPDDIAQPSPPTYINRGSPPSSPHATIVIWTRSNQRTGWILTRPGSAFVTSVGLITLSDAKIIPPYLLPPPSLPPPPPVPAPPPPPPPPPDETEKSSRST